MVYLLDGMPTIGNKSVPSYLHMMQHVFRSKIYQSRVKSIINTERALIIGQHTHIRCLDGIACKRTIVEPKIAQSQHYKKEPKEPQFKFKKLKKSKKNIVIETRILRNLETVMKNTKITLANIFFD